MVAGIPLAVLDQSILPSKEFQMNLSTATKAIRLSNAATAATTSITSSALDCKGFDGALFIVSMGAIGATSVCTAKLQQSSDDGVADAYSDLLDTSISIADDDDNQLVMIDITKPQKRYLKLVLARATATAVVDGIMAQLYNPKNEPTTHDSATVVGFELHNSPAEGTA